MAERLKPQTPILRSGVQALPAAFLLTLGSFLHFVSFHPGVYIIWVPVTYYLGVTLRWTSIPFWGAAILLRLLHVKETEIRSGRLGLWLLRTFFNLFFLTSFRRDVGLGMGLKARESRGRGGTGR